MPEWKEVEAMNYCKADLKTGKPLIVADLVNGSKINTNKWSWEGFDKNGVPTRFECEYVEGKKDPSGARAKLRKSILC
jgi:hypothetical protein